MKKSIIILISLIAGTGILVFLGLAYLFFFVGMELIPPKTQQLNNLRETQIVEIRARDDQEHIHGLLLEVYGDISDSLTFTFGTSDSTIYRTELLTPGVVDFKYNADWYSTLCFVTFEPTTDSIDGELQLEYKFFGD